jgi:hypothetical protein
MCFRTLGKTFSDMVALGGGGTVMMPMEARSIGKANLDLVHCFAYIALLRSARISDEMFNLYLQ